MNLLPTPTQRMFGAVYLCAALLAIATWGVMQFPSSSVRFVGRDGAWVTVVDQGRIAAKLRATDPVVFQQGGQSLTVRALDLAFDKAPPVGGSEARAYFGAFDRLYRMGLAGSIRVTAPGLSAPLILKLRSRGLFDLGWDYWILTLGGIGCCLLGAWIGLLRPAEWGARMLALSGFSLMLSSASSGVFFARDVAAPGAVLQAMAHINMIGSLVCGGAMVAQFCGYPHRVVGRRVLIAICVVTAVVCVGVVTGWAPVTVSFALMLAEFVALIVLFLIQRRRSVGDPLARAALRWIGLSTLAGATTFVVISLAPLMNGRAPFVSQGFSFLPLFGIYLGIAAGVGRYRLFDLDQWAYRIILTVAGACLLLMSDVVLLAVLRLEAASAFGLSLLVAGLAYLPARNALWRLVTGQKRMPEADIFAMLEGVRFERDETLREQGWRDLLQTLFKPLEIAAVRSEAEHPMLLKDGLELTVPSVGAQGALIMRYAGLGQKLFTRADVRLVGQFVALMHSAEAIRDSYKRGVEEERGRIARDLHDDVSGRLLTSLHAPDSRLIREDVRTAVADIRTIIRGLTGERLPVSEILATLRHETFTRLDAAKVALDWRVELSPATDPVLDYAQYRAISSAHREVVTNILRHAQAASVRVVHSLTPEILRIHLEDDGIGFGGDGAARPGRGIGHVQRRLQELGGSAVFDDTGQGLRVELILPLSRS